MIKITFTDFDPAIKNNTYEDQTLIFDSIEAFWIAFPNAIITSQRIL